MPYLSLNSLPPHGSRDLIFRLLCDAGIDRKQIGRIEVRGKQAVVEVPDNWAQRLAKALDGMSLEGRHISVTVQDAAAPITSPQGGKKPRTNENHFDRLARLLDLESEAEAREALKKRQQRSAAEAEASGECLTGLVVRDESTGLGGRALITLGKRNPQSRLPWSRLGVGAPVLLSGEDSREDSGWRGVVCQRDDSSIEVAFSTWPDDDRGDGPFRLDLSNNEISRDRQRAALDRAKVAERERLAELREVLVEQSAPEFNAIDELEPLAEGLNDSQRDAVQFALSAADYAVIHGPPGTGKSTVLVELIRQAVRRGERVLACAPSNLAVDNLLERLWLYGEEAVRLGHPARVLPELRERTLDLLVDAHPDVRRARKLVKEARALRNKAARFTRAKPEPGAKREMRQEAKELMADARRWEAQIVEQILDSATVLCATLTSLDSEILGKREFDLVVIDEACQCTEPECWIPLLRSKRVVFAGDHCQLPPTVISNEARQQGFGVSLLERLVAERGTEISRRLDIQYRMHEAIMDFSSMEFYDATLIADESVRKHLLHELPGITEGPLTETPVRFIDTAGAGYDEELEDSGGSRRNRQEAELALRQVQELREAGVSATSIAVMTPYSAQVRLLRELCEFPNVELDTIDGFQGREKEAVVISLVRSNTEGEIGFLSDVRRMNVALTRARRKLIVIGDSATIGSHPFYQRLLEYFESLGAYGTVWE